MGYEAAVLFASFWHLFVCLHIVRVQWTGTSASTSRPSIAGLYVCSFALLVGARGIRLPRPTSARSCTSSWSTWGAASACLGPQTRWRGLGVFPLPPLDGLKG